MPAKLTLHPPQRAPRLLILHDGESMDIGRDAACGLIVEDGRVSKRHARLRWTGSGWLLEDLGSKNGTTLNGAPVSAASPELREGDWICLGGLMARFEHLTAAQAANLDSERLAQVQSSAEMRRRLGGDLPPLDLMLRLLELAMEVATAERGFVLIAGADGRLRPEVAVGFSVQDLREERFRGSVGAVKQALESGVLAISDAIADPRLGKRPSVVAEGIRSLACLPLRHGEKQLGVLYVDRRKPGPPFTVLDVETLEILADRASALLAPSLPDWRAHETASRAEGELITQLKRRFDELLGMAG
jgi:FHA domain-containing protein/GAF domain-containing protein